MRLTLVQPPSGLYDHYDLAPPLGLLTLAAFVERDGVEVALVDMNLRGQLDHAWVQRDFWRHAVDAVGETDPDVVGFTSMAVESHVCIEIARLLKLQDPGLRIVLGGPHFGSIAARALELYPWIDFVVLGEGETAMRDLMRHLQGLVPAGALVNVAQRAADGVRLERVKKPLDALDALPFPAYDKVELEPYFSLNPTRLLDYEHGRGCIFACSFCYSPVHWGQGSQVKQVDRIVEEVGTLYAMGARHLFFVQDNFPNSPPLARAICRALASANTGMTWNCYATLPHLTPEFLDDLAAAGCRAVFVGVDAVSAESKAAFAKSFYKGWEKLAQKLDACLSRGIVPTCAFMIDPPLEDHVNTDAALSTALFARVKGCGIRLNTLTLYNDTVSERQAHDVPRSYTNLKPRLLLDTPDVIQENPYARENPELFPFHSTILDPSVYERFVTGMHLAYTLFATFPRTLLQYVLVDGGSLWELLDGFAQRIGSLVKVPAVLRRPMERELFLDDFRKRVVSPQTRRAFDLEVAEFTLGENVPPRSVPVRVDADVRRYHAAPFRVLDLSEHPARFDEVAPLQAGSAETSPYLLLRRNGRIRYFEIDDDVVGTLRHIEGGAPQDGAVPVEPSLLGELLDTGVLTTV
ncbi:MAG: B12-binding domain-containing radical SAM protein [Candidatus Eremiobacteraeota bacterium]|nr:B12-binding domain-containing radical SAM protein [Candidatus Eremiobacteraeota bacterium]